MTDRRYLAQLRLLTVIFLSLASLVDLASGTPAKADSSTLVHHGGKRPAPPEDISALLGLEMEYRFHAYQ
jgi:hypothetical protein